MSWIDESRPRPTVTEWVPLRDPLLPQARRRRPSALILRNQVGLHNLPSGIEAETITIIGCPNLGVIAGNICATNLIVQNCSGLREIAATCRFENIRVDDCPVFSALPQGLRAKTVQISGCQSLRSLPAGMDVAEFTMLGSSIERLPVDLYARRLNLSQSHALKRIPDGVQFSELILRRCTALRRLPRAFNARTVDLTGCVRFDGWNDDVCITVDTLNIEGCRSMRSLPAGIVAQTIELADSGLTSPSPATERAALRWRGFRIAHELAFDAGRLTASAILDVPNAELRRILIERMGLARFMAEAAPQVLDRDRDTGGQRLLLRIVLARDEPLCALSVACPTTGRRYMLRVPPTMRNCAQAAAWLAGFNDPAEYRPVI